jgi:PleD family two-component response regulator
MSSCGKYTIGVEKLNIPHESSAVSDYVTISLGVATMVPSEQCSIKEFIWLLFLR